MTMHMETMQEMTVVYIRCIGPYGTDNRDMMERLKHWARAKGLLESGVILGAAWDDPARTPPERCRYDVCLTTEGCFPELEEGMIPEWIPGGRYACFQGGTYARWHPDSLANQLCRVGGAWHCPGSRPSCAGTLSV